MRVNSCILKHKNIALHYSAPGCIVQSTLPMVKAVLGMSYRVLAHHEPLSVSLVMQAVVTDCIVYILHNKIQSVLAENQHISYMSNNKRRATYSCQRSASWQRTAAVRADSVPPRGIDCTKENPSWQEASCTCRQHFTNTAKTPLSLVWHCHDPCSDLVGLCACQ